MRLWRIPPFRDYESLRKKGPTGPNYQVTEAESSQFPLYDTVQRAGLHRLPQCRNCYIGMAIYYIMASMPCKGIAGGGGGGRQCNKRQHDNQPANERNLGGEAPPLLCKPPPKHHTTIKWDGGASGHEVLAGARWSCLQKGTINRCW